LSINLPALNPARALFFDGKPASDSREPETGGLCLAFWHPFSQGLRT
jgi:hypothetical protein